MQATRKWHIESVLRRNIFLRKQRTLELLHFYYSLSLLIVIKRNQTLRTHKKKSLSIGLGSQSVNARGVLQENRWGEEKWPASQNPYPIYDQNLRFSLPYLWPDWKFDTLIMTFAVGTVALNIIYEGFFVDGLIDNVEKVVSSKNILNSRSHTLFMTKTAKMDTLFMTKTAENPYWFGAAHTDIPHV